MSDKICPVCGANTLNLIEAEETLQDTFGGQQCLKLKRYLCSSCNSEGDFFNENDEIISKTLELLNEQSTKNILQAFIDNKISMSAIERVLSLPQRTLTKWKNGAKPSAAGLALLKYLGTFPWLLEVAENKFDYDSAQKIHIREAVNQFLRTAKFNKEPYISVLHIETSAHRINYSWMIYESQLPPMGNVCQNNAGSIGLGTTSTKSMNSLPLNKQICL